MKNPNGYGSVITLSGKRRRPYAVRKTIGWNDKGHPIYKYFGYYEKKAEALKSLAELNKKTINLNFFDWTFKEVLDLFKERVMYSFSTSKQNKFIAAYKKCESLYKRKYRDLRSFDMQRIIDACPNRKESKSDIRLLFKTLDKFALELDIIPKGYADFLTIRCENTEPKRIRKIFSLDEISRIWQDEGEIRDFILILLYTGLRKGELLTIEKQKIDIEGGFFRTGIKTEAGKNRIIPIHSKIKPIFEKYFSKTQKYSLPSVRSFDYGFFTYMKKLGFDHIPHETRHTFRTRLDDLDGNQRCIDLLMGHVSNGGTGAKVYTHKTFLQLKKTIELLQY